MARFFGTEKYDWSKNFPSVVVIVVVVGDVSIVLVTKSSQLINLSLSENLWAGNGLDERRHDYLLASTPGGGSLEFDKLARITQAI